MKFPTYSDIQPETAATQTKESAGKPSTFGKFKNLFTKKRQPDALPISARAAAVTDDDTPIHGPARTWQQAFNTEAGLEEGIKAELTREKLADVWLPDAYRPAPIAQLVALAAHACHSSSPDNGTSSFVSKAKEPADSVFRECLHSSQRTFLCAEANLGPSTGLPVLVFAISDRVLSWTEYAQHLPIGPQDQIPGRQGHFHPSVHKAVTKLPLQQLAWLLFDQDCRLIICGQGPAGAIAQHATSQIQQQLRELAPDQDSTRNGRVLCVTFGAPPSSLASPKMNPKMKLESVWDDSHLKKSLFWNFLLATTLEADATSSQSFSNKQVLFDIVPAILGTIPAGFNASKRWLSGVQDVLDALESRYEARPLLDQAIHAVMTAGEVNMVPSYVGSLWLLEANSAPIKLLNPKKLMKVTELDTTTYERRQDCWPDYWKASHDVGISLYSIAPQMHTSLMSHLKLGDDVKGLFTPLIAQASKSAQNRLGKSKAMVGCHIKLEGEGVQWLGGEGMEVTMIGGEYGQLNLTLDRPQATRFSGMTAPARPKEPLHTGDTAADAEPRYHVTIHGNLGRYAGEFPPPQPDTRIEIYLKLETHFESRKIRLLTEQSEEDATALKAKLSSAEVNYVLKRAILWAASCLASESDFFQKKGNEVLTDIDVLESWCRVNPTDLPFKFSHTIGITDTEIHWSAQTIKENITGCCQTAKRAQEKQQKQSVHGQEMSELAPGETASGEGVMFSELKEHSEEWLANSNGIAAVLATSLLLEFKLETLDYAILGVLATLTVVSVVVPFVIPGAVAATAVACTLRALPVLWTVGQLAWTWWGMQQLYQMAYLAKLEQLVGLLAPGKNTQRDATMLENVLYEVCEKAMKENTTLGELLRGPSALSSGVSSSKLSLPGALPIWKRGQLENMKRYRLPNGRRLTITCSQVFSTHLNRIFALVRLRRCIQDICLVGCVGDINAGKTTFVRALRGLPLVADGHCTELATTCVSVFPMPLHTPEGLKQSSGAPLLVDTPGMFDQNGVLADSALQFLGSMAMYIVILPGSKSGRIEVTMLHRILDILLSGKPTLICFNQMSRYLDWWGTAEAAKSAVDNIHQQVRAEGGNDTPLTVYLTEFRDYEQNREAMESVEKCDALIISMLWQSCFRGFNVGSRRLGNIQTPQIAQLSLSLFRN